MKTLADYYEVARRHSDRNFLIMPNEEGGAGGKAMIKDGLFEQFPVDAVFGIHNWPGIPAGHFGVTEGPMMAFEVILERIPDAKAKPIIFHAVAANGPDVWAGGSEASLFHSTDSGDHWIRIQPSWRGVLLSGDILSLQFGDPQHGRIVTSTAEIWTTADAGQTWDKQ